jgi:hypothetical protein
MGPKWISRHTLDQSRAGSDVRDSSPGSRQAVSRLLVNAQRRFRGGMSDVSNSAGASTSAAGS